MREWPAVHYAGVAFKDISPPAFAGNGPFHVHSHQPFLDVGSAAWGFCSLYSVQLELLTFYDGQPRTDRQHDPSSEVHGGPTVTSCPPPWMMPSPATILHELLHCSTLSNIQSHAILWPVVRYVEVP